MDDETGGIRRRLHFKVKVFFERRRCGDVVPEGVRHGCDVLH